MFTNKKRSQSYFYGKNVMRSPAVGGVKKRQDDYCRRSTVVSYAPQKVEKKTTSGLSY